MWSFTRLCLSFPLCIMGAMLPHTDGALGQLGRDRALWGAMCLMLGTQSTQHVGDTRQIPVPFPHCWATTPIPLSPIPLWS